MHTSLLVAVDQWLVRSLKQEIMCSELDIYRYMQHIGFIAYDPEQ